MSSECRLTRANSRQKQTQQIEFHGRVSFRLCLFLVDRLFLLLERKRQQQFGSSRLEYDCGKLQMIAQLLVGAMALADSLLVL